MAKVLIIEDNLEYQQLLLENLEILGHDVIKMSEKPAEILIEHEQYNDCDLLIIDYMLPEMTGVDFVKYFKKVAPNVKIMMITAFEEEEIELLALDMDVDLFLNKKMSSDKLQKYVTRILARNKKDESTEKCKILESKVEDIVIDLSAHEIRKNGEIIYLTYTEYNLLVFFMKNMGKALSRGEILSNVWEFSVDEISERIVDTHVKILRKKLNIYSIQSIRGIGYKWDE